MASSLRITFVLPYAGLVGGVRVVAIYADHLQRLGHHVTVVSTPRPKLPLRKAARSLLRGRKVRHPQPGDKFFEGVNVEHRVLPRYRPVTDADVPDADVVVATWWETAPWVADLSPRKGAKAYFVQDYGANEGQPLDKVVPTWDLPLHKITISQWLLGLIAEHSGDTDVTYVPNAVDTGRFYAAPRGRQPVPTVGFMYSTRPQKGVDIALDAIAQARRSIPQLHVVAYGASPPSPGLPLPQACDYALLAPDEMLKSIYGRCDAWIFSSRLEGFGLPILEAMACRTPVIATPAGAAFELLSDGGGIILDAADARKMADAITRLVQMPDDDWRAMSTIAYQTATQYSWADAASRFEAGLRDAIRKAALLAAS